MPVLTLPDILNEQLHQSASGTINSTEGPGVAVYQDSDRTVRADVYIGLKLDGFTRYQNISSVNPNIKMQFALQPVVFCESDDVVFDPDVDEVISIKVSRHS